MAKGKDDAQKKLDGNKKKATASKGKTGGKTHKGRPIKVHTKDTSDGRPCPTCNEPGEFVGRFTGEPVQSEQYRCTNKKCKAHGTVYNVPPR